MVLPNFHQMSLFEVHQWLCHPGEDCKDGCDVAPIPARLKAMEES